MTTMVNSYAAPSATEDLIPTRIERRAVGPHDVLIDIKYSGICHSDIHTVRGEWGPQHHSLVPGHEIAGIVAEVGSEVSKFQVGDRDGSVTQGGYATQVVVTQVFVLGIPEALELDAAAPLLCAGSTTFSPLKRWARTRERRWPSWVSAGWATWL